MQLLTKTQTAHTIEAPDSFGFQYKIRIRRSGHPDAKNKTTDKQRSKRATEGRREYLAAVARCKNDKALKDFPDTPTPQDLSKADARFKAYIQESTGDRDMVEEMFDKAARAVVSWTSTAPGAKKLTKGAFTIAAIKKEFFSDNVNMIPRFRHAERNEDGTFVYLEPGDGAFDMLIKLCRDHFEEMRAAVTAESERLTAMEDKPTEDERTAAIEAVSEKATEDFNAALDATGYEQSPNYGQSYAVAMANFILETSVDLQATVKSGLGFLA